jgi:hypothetical protein
VRIADRQRARRQPAWRTWALAAMVAVSAGLGIQLLRMHSTLQDLSRPIFDPYSKEIAFQGGTRGMPEVVEIPAGTKQVQLTFLLGDSSDHGAYRIEVLDGAGRSLYLTEAAPAQDYYILTLRPAMLRHPLVRFRLLGITDDTTTVVDEQRIVFRFEEEP